MSRIRSNELTATDSAGLWEGFPDPEPQSGVHLIGSEGNDTLTGAGNNDLLEGRAGNDYLRGLAGDDTLLGGAGNDLLVGDEGDDTLDGGTGNDLLLGASGNDTYLWGPESGSASINDYNGNDTIRIAANPDDVILSKSGPREGPLHISLNGQTLTVMGYFDTAEGGGYIDNIVFEDGTVWHLEDVLTELGLPVPPPLPGGIRLIGSAGKDTLDGTDGTDTISGGGSDDFLRGYKGSDILNGDEGNDYLVGDEGDDTLDGGTGDDHLSGAHGNDTYLWGAQSGSDFIWDYTGSDTILIDASAADVRVSKFLSIPDGPLFIHLGNASLSINDYFNMSENGGYIDNIVFKDGTIWHMQDVLAALGQTNPPPPPSGLHLVGTALEDTLNGGTGNDTLDGASGDDALYGGKGDDIYIWNPGSGNDLIQDSGGTDTVRINAASSAVELLAHLDGTLVISLDGQKLTIRNYLATGTEGRHIEQLVFADGASWDLNKVLEILDAQIPPPPPPPPPAGLYLVGTSGNDTLSGGTGNDTIDGSLGDDVLYGGAGNDVYVWGGSEGHDLIGDQGGADIVKIGATSSEVDLLMHLDGTLVISTNDSALTIRNYLATSESGGHIEKLAFSDGAVWNLDRVLEVLAEQQPNPEPEPEGEIIVGQKGNDVLIGTVNDDTLMGGIGRDTLSGGAGSDILVGGQGKDILTGGSGEDFFVFMKKSDLGLGSSRDKINDFEAGTDLIDLGKIDANSATKKNDAFKVLLKNKAAFTKAGQLHYDAKTGILSGNTDKDAKAEFQILLKKTKALHLDDFIL